MGLRDKLRKGPSHDEDSIRRLLEGSGATAVEAQEIVQALGRRLTPDKMYVWLADPKRSHPVRDPEIAKEFEEKGLAAVDLNWTPINAVGAGKADLVVAEARRYAGA